MLKSIMILVDKQKNKVELVLMQYKNYFHLFWSPRLYMRKSREPKSARIVNNTADTRKDYWLWILSGILVGILITSIIFIKFNPGRNINTPLLESRFIDNGNGAEIKQNPKHTVKKTTSQPTTISKEKEPVFDFYTVLPQMENQTTNIDKQPKEPAIKENIEQTNQFEKPEKIIPTKYILRVATFETMDEADELKVELTLNGFDAIIEPMQKNNVTWYQIIMGPFTTENQAISQQKLLEKQNINSHLLKIN